MRPEEDSFTAHVLDLLGTWSEVVAKRMFGGIGLFSHGRMFAIIIDDVLYLKDSKDENGVSLKTDFDKEYFEYDRNGKTVNLGYFRAPEAALEESEYLIKLANDSFRSANLSAKKKASKVSKKSKCNFKSSQEKAQKKPGRGRF
ncbi:MAG TPA: TfoX/Sxy family protein [Drouetiella sp.]|jgi:DNA transformation protein and related proteins